MTDRAARRISVGVLDLAVVLVAVALAASIQASGHPPAAPIVVGDPTVADGPDALATIRTVIASGATSVATAPTVGNVLAIVLALLWIATGALIVSRQARNLAGWIFVVIGFGWVCEAFGGAVTTWALYGGHRIPAQGLLALMGETSLLPALLLPLLFLLYPDGRPPERWGWLTWTIFGAIGLVLVGYVLGPGPLNNFVDAGILYANPVGIASLEGVAGGVTAAGTITMLLAALATVLAIRSRYRGSSGEQRQRLRWLVAVATLAGALLALGIVVTIAGSAIAGDQNDGPPVFTAVLVLLALTVTLGVPGAYLVAIFRYHLWDLDVVIRKARVALVLTLVLGIPTALAVLLAGQVFMWNWAPRPIVFAGGMLVGVLLVPLIGWEGTVARRIAYGRRASGYEVLTTFGEHVGGSYSVEDVAPRMVRVLANATGATSARVLLRVGADVREAAATGDPTGEEHTFPVIDRGEELGALVVTFGPSDPIDDTKERLIRDLVAHAGPVLHNVRLIEELRASRQRLVAAQDEERRKLERDIHDGVQQQLVALAVKLKLADAMVDRDPAKAREALAGLQTDAGTALEDLRDLARGIYPPLLADKGLVAALAAQARKAAIAVRVESDGVARYPREVESTVYFCTLEALNNVAKYARAASATVRLAQADGNLTFTVTDDGEGFDPSSRSFGTGLQGMADRLDAIGGTLAVDSTPGTGTIVSGTVPVEGAS